MALYGSEDINLLLVRKKVVLINSADQAGLILLRINSGGEKLDNLEIPACA